MALEAVLLGTAQDGGVPQAGCSCPTCRAAHQDPGQRQFVVALGLIDQQAGQSWLIDATPDFRQQLHALQALAPTCPLAGILLTHDHMGHYTGLIHLGMEAMAADRMPVYATTAMADFLHRNAPWSDLIRRNNIDLRLLRPEVETSLSANLRVTPYLVPHRRDYSDTVAFVVRGPARNLFYCPDIDSWERWSYDLPDFLRAMDVALLDASFFSPAELPGRDLSQIPHPFVTDTVARLSGVACQAYLIHLNHSNPLYRPGPEQAWLTTQKVEVGQFGMRWHLG